MSMVSTEDVPPSSDGNGDGEKRRRVIVGYAFAAKKVKTFMQPKLQEAASKRGIVFVEIDPNRLVSDQGPFDIVLHKLSGKEWLQSLELRKRNLLGEGPLNDFIEQHPEVTVVEPPYAIRGLDNRETMLQCVVDMDLSDSHGKFSIPKQLVIENDSLPITNAVKEAGLKLPLIVKPLVVDGSSKSHEMSLALDESSLQELKPPVVLQEFVNHGGVLFKVYVIGDAVEVVTRCSLPDVHKFDLPSNTGVYRLARVSSISVSADENDSDASVYDLPPRTLMDKLVQGLCTHLGLRLFNVDVIRESGTKDQYYVVDINYFPGFEKLPEYECAFTDFLWRLAESQNKKNSC